MRILTSLLPAMLPLALAAGEPAPKVPGAVIHRDLAFLPEGHAEKLDLFLPQDAPAGKRLPLVMFVHGGGWVGGDKIDRRSDNIGTVLVKEGYAVASVNYRLAEKPCQDYFQAIEKAFPQNLQDVKSSVRFLRKNAATWNLDPERIALMGASAGAHLAALAALTGPADGLELKDDGLGDTSSKVACLVGLYGAYDWATFVPRSQSNDALKELARRASPTTWADPSDPPVYLIHGTNDKHVPHTQTEKLREALTAAKVSVQAVIVPGAPHSFDFRLTEHDLAKDVLPFLARHLKAAAP